MFQTTEYRQLVPQDEQYIDIHGIAELCQVSHRTVEGWRARGLLPNPTAITARCHRWQLGVIRRWLASHTTVSV